MDPGDVLIDTLILMPNGYYYARVLEDGEVKWRPLPEDVAQRIIGELERALRELPDAIGPVPDVSP